MNGQKKDLDTGRGWERLIKEGARMAVKDPVDKRNRRVGKGPKGEANLSRENVANKGFLKLDTPYPRDKKGDTCQTVRRLMDKDKASQCRHGVFRSSVL